MLSRAAGVLTVAGALVGLSAYPALADGGWGSVTCEQNSHPGCELGAGKGGGANPPQTPAPHPHQHRSTGGGKEQAPPRFSNPDLNLANCSYKPSDYKPPPGAQQAAYRRNSPDSSGSSDAVPATLTTTADTHHVVPAVDRKSGKKGSWYVYKCSGNGNRDAYYRPPIWIPDGKRHATAPSPEQIAQRARKQLRLPSPRIEASPAHEQLVNLPTWLWLDNGDWRKVSATAKVPGVSVTAVARPASVVWTMGDGAEVVCKGPGHRYGGRGSKNPRKESPDCGHTYRTSSAHRPGHTYPVSATVHWTVAWSGAGKNGTFPGMTTTSDASFRVGESQAINTGE